MAKVLHIQASPRGESYSSRVAREFLSAVRRAHPADTVETLDLFQADLPPFAAPQAKAKYAVLAGQTPRDEAQAAWAAVLRWVNHFKGFDKYVVSSPMWNFNIPYRLKQYIDVIVQPGMTFRWSAEKGYEGLVTGKPLALVLARGGEYGPGDPTQTFDFQETYLRGVFGFIGFTDVQSVSVQGTLMNAPEQVEADLRRAVARAVELAPRFGAAPPGAR